MEELNIPRNVHLTHVMMTGVECIGIEGGFSETFVPRGGVKQGDVLVSLLLNITLKKL